MSGYRSRLAPDLFWRIAMWASLALLAVLLGGLGHLLYTWVIHHLL